MKDVIGQAIFYYPISTMKTQVHPVYDEAIEKIFLAPIKLDVLAGQPNWETKYNVWGNEQVNKLEIFVHVKDLLDKGYTVQEGDFFVYGDAVFEVLTANSINNIFGQVEYDVGIKIEGQIARKGQFDINIFKQMLIDAGINYVDNTVQKVWQQQRGLDENIDGPTGDKREMRNRLNEDMAEVALGEGPRVVNVDSEANEPQHKPQEASSFDNDSPNYPDIPDIYNE
ncbi:MAG: hypothetical protein WC761_01380 [Candidatus Paceibacterota bacterium]